MAEGDFTFFDQFETDKWNKVHDIDDTWKMALITSATTPSATDAAPHFGGTGTTDLSTNECTAGGNYTAGGPTLANAAISVASSIHKLDWDDVSIAINASNPTDARWGIVYNDTDANKRCMGFVDLGSVRDLTAAAFSYVPDATNGVARYGVGTIT